MLIGQVGATGTPTPIPTPFIGSTLFYALVAIVIIAIVVIAYFLLTRKKK